MTTFASRHDDMRARYALILELDDDTLRAKLLTQSDIHALAKATTASALIRANLPHSDERVEELLALTDALVFQRTAITEGTSVEAILTAYLRGLE